MKKQILPVALLVVFIGSAPGAWAQSNHGRGHHNAPPTTTSAPWTEFPVIEPVKGRFSRSAKKVRASNINAESISIWTSVEGDELQKAKATAQREEGGNSFAVPANGIGGYRYLVAQQETANQVISAATTTYFSMPSPAPREMLALSKSKLEVLPVDLPREHQHFQENTTWSFMVRFEGKPIQGSKVSFETKNGTKQEFETDHEGKFKIKFPEDFPKPKNDTASGHGRRYAQFVIATQHSANGSDYISAFNDQYAPGPYSQKSVWAGLGFMVLGMVGALPLWRRKNKQGA